MNQISQITEDAEAILQIVLRYGRISEASGIPFKRDHTLNKVANFHYSVHGPLRLHDMANAPRDQDIAHDVAGILSFFDVTTGTLDPQAFWTPRYGGSRS